MLCEESFGLGRRARSWSQVEVYHRLLPIFCHMIGDQLQCMFLVLPVLGNRPSRFDAKHLERVK
jgi:hypothetical protein